VPKASCSDEEFVEIWESEGAKGIVSRGYSSERNAMYRRKRIQQRIGRLILSPQQRMRQMAHPERVHFSLRDGYVIVANDFHYWPHIISVSHRALLFFSKKLKPKAIVANGDVLDGATISRHPPINWDNQPSLKAELEVCKERLDEIRAANKNAEAFFWPLGNHDLRFEMRLAAQVPEFKGVPGSSLKDHFPEWVPCYTLFINDNVVVKHRFKGGMNAPRNNTLYAGRTMLTGHLHSQKCIPLTDYDGTRWGVDTGCMADPFGPQFMYQEDSPRDHREGFAVLRFVDGELLQPQLVRVIDEDHVDYCNEVYAV
jgi:hypothetical protein